MMNVSVRLGFIPQKGPQLAFLKCPSDIVVYGGARGGGKTYASLGEFWIHAEDHGPDAVGLIVRRSREDLKDTIATAIRMYGNAARYAEKGNVFRFANGARLNCAYLENDRDAENYQGWSLTRVYVEELTQFQLPDPVFKLLATLRSSRGIKPQMRCTCNPGGPGHGWVKEWIIDHGEYELVTDPESGLTRTFIPAKLKDNPALLDSDPQYINRLKAVGSTELVRAWLDGDWTVIEGAFFPEFRPDRHIIEPFDIPDEWTRWRAADWGSAKPFSIGWYTHVQDDLHHDGRLLKRGAIIRYAEWYGAAKANVGLHMTAEEVANGIVYRETQGGKRQKMAYGILDPSAFAVISGPSIAETLARHGAPFRRADNTRKSTDKRMGGWDQVRNRLKGDKDGNPMLFVFATGRHLIRTLPMMQHDPYNPEDLDTEAEDHAVDELRYACMSRPFGVRTEKLDSKNPYLISNIFKIKEHG
jgi:hypothetical protein